MIQVAEWVAITTGVGVLVTAVAALVTSLRQSQRIDRTERKVDNTHDLLVNIHVLVESIQVHTNSMVTKLLTASEAVAHEKGRDSVLEEQAMVQRGIAALDKTKAEAEAKAEKVKDGG